MHREFLSVLHSSRLLAEKYYRKHYIQILRQGFRICHVRAKMTSFLATQSNLNSHTSFTRSTCIPHTKHPFYGSRCTTFLPVIRHLISILSIGTLFQTNTKIIFEVLESLEESLPQYDKFSLLIVSFIRPAKARACSNLTSTLQNHPLTDLPAFFIHPCGTKEAMEQFNCLLKDYLGVWLGLVGGYVGLWLPPAMA